MKRRGAATVTPDTWVNWLVERRLSQNAARLKSLRAELARSTSSSPSR